MQKLVRLEGVAAPFPQENVDTDAIIPVAAMKAMDVDWGRALFTNLRYRPDGSEEPGFVLNQAPYRKAVMLVALDNFGCGSSREQAVWALLGFGIRCVVAPSFGDIFYNSSLRQGLLPVRLAPAPCRALLDAVARAGGAAPTVMDLEAQTVTGPDGTVHPFAVDAVRRRALLEGLDGIGVTLLQADRIEAFRARDRRLRPWVHAIDPHALTERSRP